MIKKQIWFSQMGNDKIIGIVITEDDITKERKAFLGTGSGLNESGDALHVAQTGAKIHHSMIESILEQLSDVSIEDIEKEIVKLKNERDELKDQNTILERRVKKLKNVIFTIKKNSETNVSVMTTIFDFVDAFENQLNDGLLSARSFATDYFKSISKNGRR
ncbi:MAG: hypothetical protein DRH08_06175 [Deltaproteobacteria bacterium]|nr:MAG: hypothetical protein DRH08_06175 [Deltaproteobacteria bacterium]